MEQFGLSRERELRKFLELPHGIPDESTFFRVFTRVKSEALSRCVYEWLAEVRGGAGATINIDGKTIRGSGNGEKPAVHMVSAWAGDREIVLGQLAVAEKSNEITAIPKLLELLDIRGAMVSIDAMGCQKEIAAGIRKKHADYVLAVKENQPTLYHDIKDYFEGMEGGQIRELPDDIWETGEERGHGRLEKREIRTVTGLSWLEGKADWKDLATIIQCRSYRTIKEETTRTDRYYISSSLSDALELYDCIRGHWSIENQLHWGLDVIFREDASRVTKDHGPENLNTLRKLALSLLRAAPSPRSGKKKITGPKRQFIAAMNPDYLFTVLFEK
jgi:predicted transposase YbfD/YdcC